MPDNPLPVHHEAVAPRPHRRTSSIRPRAETHAQIVVVDAHGDTRDLYAAWFTFVGFRVTPCSTAADALAIVRRDPAAAVLISIRLPGEDGLTLSEMLKADPETADVPLIALTSNSPDHQRAVRSGNFAAVVMIPCSPADLLVVVTSVLTSNLHGPAHVAA